MALKDSVEYRSFCGVEGPVPEQWYKNLTLDPKFRVIAF
jgi:hypothetical protein